MVQFSETPQFKPSVREGELSLRLICIVIVIILLFV